MSIRLQRYVSLIAFLGEFSYSFNRVWFLSCLILFILFCEFRENNCSSLGGLFICKNVPGYFLRAYYIYYIYITLCIYIHTHTYVSVYLSIYLSIYIFFGMRAAFGFDPYCFFLHSFCSGCYLHADVWPVYASRKMEVMAGLVASAWFVDSWQWQGPTGLWCRLLLVSESWKVAATLRHM